MKWLLAIVCALVMMQALVVVAHEATAFSQLTSSEKLAHYESQLEQLRSQQAAFEAGAQDMHFKQAITAEAATSTQASTGTANPKLVKLATAMSAVKDDIMAKLREAQRESQWVKEVENIVKEYKKKVKNVKKNLAKIRKDIKELIKKKRQIRNAQIQEQLQDRLQDASGDLQMVQGKLSSINTQQKAFEANRKKIANTIARINAEMKHLRGEKPPAPKAKKADKKKADKKKADKKKADKKADKKKAAKKADKKKAAKKDGKKAKKSLPKSVKKQCKKQCKKGDKKCFKKCAKSTLKKCKKQCKKGDKKCFEKCVTTPAPKKSFLEADASAEDLLAEFA